METPGLNIESLDVQDAEVTPEPVLETPPPSPPSQEPSAPASSEAKAEAKTETIEQARDPETGEFVAKEEPKPAEPAKAEPQKVVPLASHLEERRRYQQEIAERDKRLADINERLAKLEPQAKPVDFVEDPKGYVDETAGRVAKEVQALKQEAEGLRQEQQFASFVQHVGAQEASFVESTPDYYDAVKYIRGIRLQQLTDLYPDASVEQINQSIAQEELRAAYTYMQRNRNPAEVVYKMAQQFGYKKAEQPKPDAKTVAKVEVPKVPVGDPGSTLGSGSGGDGEAESLVEDDDTPESVLNEVFGKRFGVQR